MNLAAALQRRAEDEGWGDRPALVDDRHAVSHAEVHDGAARAAAVLDGLGVRAGDTVLLALPDRIDFAFAFLGAVRMGALAVPVNPLLPPADHRLLVEACQATTVVCADEVVDRFSDRCRVLAVSSLASSLAAVDPLPAVPLAAAAPAYAQYTSGTTGAPRAAVHRHGDPLVYADAFARPGLRLGPGDVLLSVSKAYFAYGLGNSLFFPLLTGAQAVLHAGRPDPGAIVALVRAQQVTVLFAVPTFYANLGRSQPPPTSFASLRVAVSAGERLTVPLAERTAHLLGCPVLDSLGTTEVGQAFVGGSLDATRTCTVGRALPPYEVAVRDGDGNDLPPGVAGHLWVRGPTVLVEYLGQPEDTAAAFDGDWLRTGDLASIDGEGFLSHHGRADDMETVGGITFAPQEVEEVLSRHPAVSEVAVASVTDRFGASRLCAFVVPVPGSPAGEALADELEGLGRAHLAAYKVPRSVTVVDALPRTSTGKLRRFLLRSGTADPASSVA